MLLELGNIEDLSKQLSTEQNRFFEREGIPGRRNEGKGWKLPWMCEELRESHGGYCVSLEKWAETESSRIVYATKQSVDFILGAKKPGKVSEGGLT